MPQSAVAPFAILRLYRAADIDDAYIDLVTGALYTAAPAPEGGIEWIPSPDSDAEGPAGPALWMLYDLAAVPAVGIDFGPESAYVTIIHPTLESSLFEIRNGPFAPPLARGELGTLDGLRWIMAGERSYTAVETKLRGEAASKRMALKWSRRPAESYLPPGLEGWQDA